VGLEASGAVVAVSPVVTLSHPTQMARFFIVVRHPGSGPAPSMSFSIFSPCRCCSWVPVR